MKKLLPVLILLLFVSAIIYRFAPHEVIRCYLARWSDLKKLAPNLYVDPDMPESQKQNLLSSVVDSKEDIGSFYGAYSANPVIIAGHTMDVMERYGGNSYNRTGRTYRTIAETFVILGPDGVFSKDILAHELAHAELSKRIGYWKRNEIPSWFDEGLAVQFDDRYAAVGWPSGVDDGSAIHDLDQLGTIKHDDWLGYARSKQEVGRWLDVVGEEGFRKFLQAIRNGDDFYETYQSIEEAYQTTQ